MKKTLLSSLLMGIFLLSIITVSGCTQEASAGEQVQPVQISTKEVNEQTDILETDLKIPVISGMKDEELQKEVNQEIDQYLMEIETAIKEQAQTFAQEAKEQGWEIRPYQVSSDFKLAYNDRGVVSIVLESYEYTGGAHGMTVLKTFNLDLKDGKELALKDVFNEGTDYENIINQEISKEIASHPEDYFDGDMGFNGISDEQGFYIDQEGIVIYFDLYDIAPYSSGIQKFKLSFDLFDGGVESSFAGN